MELFLGEALLTFDGRVVEAFGSRATANGRVHLAMLDRLEIGETRKDAYLQAHTVWGGAPLLVPFPKEQVVMAQQFVADVENARGTDPS